MRIINKIQNKLWQKMISFARNKKIYVFLYRSYWYYSFQKKSVRCKNSSYYAARPNPGAGIGHQMANWIAGYWFAEQFELSFAHIPFSSSKWETFLGFGEGEIAVEDLVKRGYEKVTLPLFDEFNQKEVALIRKIIVSYSNQKIVFVAEHDQFYRDQFGVMEAIKQKFHTALARNKDQLIFDKEFFNIAIHVRRGDIKIGQENKNPNLLLRWQGNDYFEKVLLRVVDNIKTNKPIAIYLFSQGEKCNFPEFSKFRNLYFCLDMSAQDSFLHMVNANLLITSKSSFSYKPALLSNGVKICPQIFWHSYPETKDFILADDNGNFDLKLLNIIQYE
jgi:hypothetical protein